MFESEAQVDSSDGWLKYIPILGTVQNKVVAVLLFLLMSLLLSLALAIVFWFICHSGENDPGRGRRGHFMHWWMGYGNYGPDDESMGTWVLSKKDLNAIAPPVRYSVMMARIKQDQNETDSLYEQDTMRSGIRANLSQMWHKVKPVWSSSNSHDNIELQNTGDAEPDIEAQNDDNDSLSPIGPTYSFVQGQINWTCPICQELISCNPEHVESSTAPATPEQGTVGTAEIDITDIRPLPPVSSKPQPEPLVRQLPCKHLYHDICIIPWVTTAKPNCPMCKISLTQF